eukprot:TRINITY_DN1452_c0_g1_i10.p1 TRINITY_DN1452_c0_g1~~TRINITY_DN1452_c0_g1_i10.p1  ORF type:complete len:1469 (+),score=550.12 TRINITY_DN1452_c0_g1_i10:141-4547(+)
MPSPIVESPHMLSHSRVSNRRLAYVYAVFCRVLENSLGPHSTGFRDSKLTHILRESFMADDHCVLAGFIRSGSIEELVSVLKFTSRIHGIIAQARAKLGPRAFGSPPKMYESLLRPTSSIPSSPVPGSPRLGSSRAAPHSSPVQQKDISQASSQLGGIMSLPAEPLQQPQRQTTGKAKSVESVNARRSFPRSRPTVTFRDDSVMQASDLVVENNLSTPTNMVSPLASSSMGTSTFASASLLQSPSKLHQSTWKADSLPSPPPRLPSDAIVDRKELVEQLHHSRIKQEAAESRSQLVERMATSQIERATDENMHLMRTLDEKNNHVDDLREQIVAMNLKHDEEVQEMKQIHGAALDKLEEQYTTDLQQTKANAEAQLHSEITQAQQNHHQEVTILQSEISSLKSNLQETDQHLNECKERIEQTESVLANEKATVSTQNDELVNLDNLLRKEKETVASLEQRILVTEESSNGVSGAYEELRKKHSELLCDHQMMNGQQRRLQSEASFHEDIAKQMKTANADLEKQLLDSQNSLREIQSMLDSEKAGNDSLTKQVKESQSNIDELRGEMNICSSQLADTTRQLEKSCNDLEKQTSRANQLDSTLAETLEALSDCRSQLGVSEASGQAASSHGVELQRALEKEERIVDQLRADKEKLKIDLEITQKSLEKLTDESTTSLEELEQALASSQRRAITAEQQLDETRSLLRKSQEDLAAEHGSVEALKHEKKQADSLISSLSSEKRRSIALQEKAQTEAGTLRAQLEGCRAQLDAQCAQLNRDKADLSRRLKSTLTELAESRTKLVSESAETQKRASGESQAKSIIKEMENKLNHEQITRESCELALKQTKEALISLEESHEALNTRYNERVEMNSTQAEQLSMGRGVRQALEEQNSDLNMKVNALHNELENSKEQLRSLQSKLHETESESNAVHRSKELLTEDLSNKDITLEQLRTEIAAAKKQIIEHESSLERECEKSGTLEAQLMEADQRAERLQSTLGEEQSAKNESIEECEELQESLQIAREQLDDLVTKGEELVAERDNLVEQLKGSTAREYELSAEVETLKAKNETSQQHLFQTRKDLEDTLSQATSARSDLTSAATHLEHMNTSQHQLEMEKQQLKTQLELSEADCSKLKGDIAKLESEVTSLKEEQNRTREKLQRTSLRAAEGEKTAESLDEVKNALSRVQSALRDNMNALKECEDKKMEFMQKNMEIESEKNILERRIAVMDNSLRDSEARWRRKERNDEEAQNETVKLMTGENTELKSTIEELTIRLAESNETSVQLERALTHSQEDVQALTDRVTSLISENEEISLLLRKNNAKMSQCESNAASSGANATRLEGEKRRLALEVETWKGMALRNKNSNMNTDIRPMARNSQKQTLEMLSSDVSSLSMDTTLNPSSPLPTSHRKDTTLSTPLKLSSMSTLTASPVTTRDYTKDNAVSMLQRQLADSQRRLKQTLKTASRTVLGTK